MYLPLLPTTHPRRFRPPSRCRQAKNSRKDEAINTRDDEQDNSIKNNAARINNKTAKDETRFFNDVSSGHRHGREVTQGRSRQDNP